jgi:hypothetical protein
VFDTNRYAFKEWAVTCQALATGRQSLLLRKGGIHERGGRFQVEHNEFWLFPTRFHQNPQEIRDDARALLKHVATEAPATGMLHVSLYAVVDEVVELIDESLLPRLASFQILTDDTLRERFHYRRLGLFVLPVRIYARVQPVVLRESPHFAGCRTWVDLEEDLPTDSLAPALSDSAHADAVLAIRRALRGIA